MFFFPFNTLDMYCWVQFILLANICCVRPSSDIRLDMAAAICREYSAQSFSPVLLFALHPSQFHKAFHLSLYSLRYLSY